MKGYSAVSRPLAATAFGFASREMEDLFDRLFHNNGSSISSGHRATWTPPVSIWEHDERYHIALDLPGVAEDQLDVSFEDGQLTIKATRVPVGREGWKVWHNERLWTEVSRTLRVPESVDPDSIEAHYGDGVLHLTMAKRPEVLPKRITVQSKSSQAE